MRTIAVCLELGGARVAALAALLIAGLTLVGAGAAQAQSDTAWVQIESYPNLSSAQSRARIYAQSLEDVNGFRATTGWYAIALGPYDPDTARSVLRTLRAQGEIPGDSYVEDGNLYASAFFPVGSTALTSGAEVPEPPLAATETAPEPVLEETLPEARRSEAQLDRGAREELQVALQWFGFYNAGIDAAFGPGTRRGMRLYQQAIGADDTGVLTTRQRRQLVESYRSELNAIGMRTVRDEAAGIEIELPLGMVEFVRYNFPFAQYDATEDSGVQVLLISQPGDRATLFGLYEIMQTLEIVPLNGTRERQRNGFVLTGQSATLRSHTEARLTGGAVKGFTLVWPPERDAQMARVLPMMRDSISYFDGALDPGAIPDGVEDGIDMVSGLEVREPDLVRSGFFVDSTGTVLTTTEIAGTCEELLINDIYPAELAYQDAELGLAVLRPRQALAPMAYARLAQTPARVRSEIAVATFPFGGALNAASMTFGQLADPRGINGEDSVQRLALRTSDSEAGGPVLDFAGTVLGMVIPDGTTNVALPEDVTLALRADRLGGVLMAAGVETTLSDRQVQMNRENLARYGADITVTVSCWN